MASVRMNLASHDDGFEMAPTPAPPAMGQVVRLRRTGERPLVFRGEEICCATSYVAGPPFWYEINVFRTGNDTFVADIRMFTKSENEKDRFVSHHAETFDEALSWLESYDPAGDIRVDLPLDDPHMPIAELGLRAAAVRLKVAEARRQYRDLLGDMLYALDS